MIKAKALAKFNLNLHILPEKLPNGYSEIKAVNCRLSLADELSFKKQKEVIELIDNSGLQKEENTVYKAAYLLKKEAGSQELGVRIKLKKNIPVKSGLGGGSADAAMTLLTLNRLWNLNFSLKKLSEIGGKLSSDIYYCLYKGIGEIGGYGEKVKIITAKMTEIWGVVVLAEETKPSTKWAYENLDRKKVGWHLYKLDKMIKAIRKKDKKEIIDNLFNDFEDSIIKPYPVIHRIKEDLKGTGALNSLLAGSGLAMVGFFENKLLAEKAKKLLAGKYQQIYLVKTI